MPTSRWPHHHRARILGISLLILSLVHAPLAAARLPQHPPPRRAGRGLRAPRPPAPLAPRRGPGRGRGGAALALVPADVRSDRISAIPATARRSTLTSAAGTRPGPTPAPWSCPTASSRPLDSPPPSPLALADVPFARAVDRPGLRAGPGSSGPSAPPSRPNFPRLAAPALVLLSAAPPIARSPARRARPSGPAVAPIHPSVFLDPIRSDADDARRPGGVNDVRPALSSEAGSARRGRGRRARRLRPCGWKFR